MIDSAKPLSQVEINKAQTYHDQFCLVCRREARACKIARLLATIDQQATEIERLKQVVREKATSRLFRREIFDTEVYP